MELYRLRDHLLAGLRLLQEAIIEGRVRDDIEDIARNGDQHPMATPEQIDQWSYALNGGAIQLVQPVRH